MSDCSILEAIPPIIGPYISLVYVIVNYFIEIDDQDAQNKTNEPFYKAFMKQSTYKLLINKLLLLDTQPIELIIFPYIFPNIYESLISTTLLFIFAINV